MRMERLEKGGGGRIKGGKGGKGRGRKVLGCWLVTYLTCISLPLIPYEMRYMGMIMSMNMNTYESVSLASSTVQVQSAWLFFASVRQVGKVGIRQASKVPTGSRRRPIYLLLLLLLSMLLVCFTSYLHVLTFARFGTSRL